MADNKYFAIVKPDTKPEIIKANWDEVRPMVEGVSNVLYKSFKDSDEAKAWAKKASEDLQIKIKNDRLKKRKAKARQKLLERFSRIGNKSSGSKAGWMRRNINTSYWNRK